MINTMQATANLEETDDHSAFGSAVTYARHAAEFAGTAALSGIDGILNTGISAANTLGGTNYDQIDTKQVLEDNGFDEAAGVYSRHKGAADTLGFIGSSIIPYVGGMRVARAVMAAGTAGKYLKFAAGLGDIVDESRRAGVISDIARAGFGDAGANASRLSMISKGFATQAVENLFGEVANTIINNQAPAMESKSKDYMDAIAQHVEDPMTYLGLGVGTAIGGVAEWSKFSKDLRVKSGAVAAERNAKFGVSDVGDLKMSNGSKLMYALTRHGEIEEAIGSGLDANDMREATKNLASQKLIVEKYVHALTGDQAITSQMVPRLLEASKTDKGSILSTLVNMDSMKAARLDEETHGAASVRAISTYGQSVDDTAHELMDNMLSLGRIPQEHIDQLGGEEGFKKAYYQAAVDELKKNNGFTWAFSGVTALNHQQAASTKNVIAKLIEQNTGVVWHSPTMDELARVYQMGGDKAIVGTLRHEQGHVLANWLEKAVAEHPDSGLVNELVELSKLARPDHWNNVAKVREMQKAGTATQAAIDWADESEPYLYKSRELLADSFAVLNNADFGGKVRGKFPLATKLFHENGILERRFGGAKRVLDLKSGDMFNPNNMIDHTGSLTAADMGVEDMGKSNGGATHLIELSGGRYVVDVAKPYNPLTADARSGAAYFWHAMNNKFVDNPEGIAYGDLPKLTRGLDALRKGETKQVTIQIENGTKHEITFGDMLADELQRQKRDFVTKLSGSKTFDTQLGMERALSHKEIARITDVSDEFALGNYAADHLDSITNDVNQVRHVVVRWNAKLTKDYAGQQADIAFNDQLELARGYADVAATKVLGQFANLAPERSVETLERTAASQAGRVSANDRQGVMSRLFGGVNRDGSSAMGFSQRIGNMVSQASSFYTKRIDDQFQPLVAAINTDRAALAEYNVLDGWHRGHDAVYHYGDSLNPYKVLEGAETKFAAGGTPRQVASAEADVVKYTNVVTAIENSGLGDFFKNANGSMRLMSRKACDALTAVMDKENVTPADFQQWMLDFKGSSIKGSHVVDVQSPKVANFLNQFHEANTALVQDEQGLHTAMGKRTRRDTNRLYLGPTNTDRLPYHAYVIPKGNAIGAPQDVGMISALDAKGLQSKIARLQELYGDHVETVRLEDDRIRYLKAKEEYNANVKHGDLLTDSDMQRRGLLSEVAPEPDKLIVGEAVQHLKNSQLKNLRKAVQVKYAQEFAEWDAYANQTGVLARSRFAANKVNTKTNDPWTEAKRLALNLSANNTDSKYLGFQNAVDEQFTRAVNGVVRASREFFKTDYNKDMGAKLAASMKDYGYVGPLDESNSAAAHIWQNAGLRNRGALTRLATTLNGVLAKGMLGFDAANALANSLSMHVTIAPELRLLHKELSEAQSNKLFEYVSNEVPDTTHRMPSGAKVVFDAVDDFFRNKAVLQSYADKGLMHPDVHAQITHTQSIGEHLRELLNSPENATSATIDKVSNALHTIGQKLQVPTQWSEKYVTAVSLRAAELLIDRSGFQMSEATKNSMMMRFAQRVNGNYVASQRPQIAQGWFGNTAAMFQNYTINMMHNVFRYAGEDKRALLTMAGLQAGIFGTSSLPGFQTMNHLIYERHHGSSDLTSATTRSFGKSMGDWILYGAGSNFMKPLLGDGIALWNRGSVGVNIPTSFSELPMIKAGTTTMGALMDTMSGIAGGESLKSAVAYGLQRQALNRSLQGLGQMMSGEVTDAHKNRVADVDMGALAVATRLMGAKPMSEQIKLESFRRLQSYKAAEQDAADDAFTDVEYTMRAGDVPSDGMIQKAMSTYIEAGGHYPAFQQKLMKLMMHGSDSAMDKLAKKYQTPEGAYMANVLAQN